MPDPSLHGNHDKCPACAPRREMLDTGAIFGPDIPCNVCDGTGHIPIGAVEIVRRTVDEARRFY